MNLLYLYIKGFKSIGKIKPNSFSSINLVAGENDIGKSKSKLYRKPFI